MNDERKAVHELTDDELRREIAEATGWRVRCLNTDMVLVKGPAWVLNPPGAMEIIHARGWNEEECWRATPNWPGDIGAAFELVRDVLDNLNARAHEEKAISVHSTWEFRLTDDGVNFTQFGFLFGHEWDCFEVEGTDARALSELAALVLLGDGELTQTPRR